MCFYIRASVYIYNVYVCVHIRHIRSRKLALARIQGVRTTEPEGTATGLSAFPTRDRRVHETRNGTILRRVVEFGKKERLWSRGNMRTTLEVSLFYFVFVADFYSTSFIVRFAILLVL